MVPIPVAIMKAMGHSYLGMTCCRRGGLDRLTRRHPYFRSKLEDPCQLIEGSSPTGLAVAFHVPRYFAVP